jgi:hypothetical protein
MTMVTKASSSCGGDEMNFHITLFGKFNPIADEIAKNAPQF